MACERWCSNRGCDGAAAACALLLGLYAIGSSLAAAETDRSRYSYAVDSWGQSPNDFGLDVSLLSEVRQDAEKEVGPTRWRRELPKESTTMKSAQDLPNADVYQQGSATSANNGVSIGISYSTENASTEADDRASKPTEATIANSTEELMIPKPRTTPQPKGITVWANQTMWKNATVARNDTKVAKDAKDAKDAKEAKDAKPTTVTEQPHRIGEPADDKEKPESDIGDISISKFSDVTNKTLAQNNITKTEEDTHQYYNSTFIVDETIGKKYWVDLDNHPELKVNNLLSQSHRRAATVKLKFDFPFYGHKVRNITIATGGFLYTGEYVHSWLAATQYIAPLMANFDTRLSNKSYVKYADNGTAFTVEWEKVVLQDKPNAGEFTFQVTLHQNGDIVFVYSAIPLVVEHIEDSVHPVKVGLSDAYIMDRTVYLVRKKTIYEYHRVNFNQQDIKNWTVIYLHALPTCLEMDNCRDCLTKDTHFDCKWCAELNQCSTGTFRSRQDWLLKGCEVRNVKEIDNCPPAATMYKEHDADYEHDGRVHPDDAVNTGEPVAKKKRPAAGSLEHARGNMNMGVSGIIGILLVIGLVAGLAVWATYAYRNPHSASGQMLIRYRPSQWTWRRGEARYTAATIHM